MQQYKTSLRGTKQNVIARHEAKRHCEADVIARHEARSKTSLRGTKQMQYQQLKL